jgi:hypothetical protein
VLLVLRWLWWRINAWGEIAAIAASLVLAPVLILALPFEQEALRLLLMAVGSTTCGIAASLATAPEPAELLDRFWQKVQPPGFWGERGGRDARLRLARGLGATAAASLSIFSLLVASGSWLAGSPPPTWLPWRGLWLVGLVLLGIALVPVCWRLGFAQRAGRKIPNELV